MPFGHFLPSIFRFQVRRCQLIVIPLQEFKAGLRACFGTVSTSVHIVETVGARHV